MIAPKKVDILEDVLTGSDEGAFPGLAELSDLLSRPKSPLPEARPPDKNRGRTRRRKKKVTHYLSPEISEDLDRILPRIRKLLPEGGRKKISKSRLVNFSLRLLLRDFEEKGEESLLVKQFLRNVRDGNGP